VTGWRKAITNRNDFPYTWFPSRPRGSRTTVQRSTVKLKANKIERSAAR
jgi:hypothetical protein